MTFRTKPDVFHTTKIFFDHMELKKLPKTIKTFRKITLPSDFLLKNEIR